MAHGAGTLTGHGAGHDGPPAAGEHEVGHPGERKYIEIAAILAGITIVEVAIYYIEWVHDNNLLVPILLALSAVKFTMVVGFFMHLKFDDRRLTWIFVTGLVVGFSVVMALYFLQGRFHPIDYARTY